MRDKWIQLKLWFAHSYMKSMIEAQKYQVLEMFVTKSKDMSIISDGIQFLYDENQWDILDNIYHASIPTSSDIQSYLVDLYQLECLRLSKEKGLSEYYRKHRSREYSKKLDTMLSQVLSIRGSIPEFRETLIDLFIEGASVPILQNRIPLILKHFPEKSEAIGNALLTRNHLLEKKYCQVSDLPIISYVFHCIEPTYEQMQEGETYLPNVSKVHITELYDKCKRLVMGYNKEIVNEFQSCIQKGIAINDEEIRIDLSKPGNPILSMVDSLLISEEEKEQIILEVECDSTMKQALLDAFRDRHENLEQMKLLDFYYVLYTNPIQQQLSMTTDQFRNQNIFQKNHEYLERMKQKKQLGYLNEEDIIGAICSLEAYPVFGLFSLISNLSIEELHSIASNLNFETAEMQKKLYEYLQCCKRVENPYSKEYQNLDVQYMKEKKAYEKMLVQESNIKKKEYL